MDKNTFLVKLADILDMTEIKGADVLVDFDAWDSLSVLSVVALADSQFGFTLTLSEVKSVETVDDLWALFESKRTK